MSVTDIVKLRGRIVLLEQEALAALDNVRSVEELRDWRKVYIEGKSPVLKDALYSEFFSTGDILDWTDGSGMTIRQMIGDETFFRWMEKEPIRAADYEGACEAHVTVVPGGYQAWLMAE